MVSTTFPPPTTLPTTLSRLLMKETFLSHVVERNQVFYVLFVWNCLKFPLKAVDLESMCSRLQELAANMARQLPKHRLRSSIRIPADCAACWCRRDMICAHQNPISQDRRSEPSCASEFGRAANIGGWDGEWEVVVGMKVVCHTLTGGGKCAGVKWRRGRIRPLTQFTDFQSCLHKLCLALTCEENVYQVQVAAGLAQVNIIFAFLPRKKNTFFGHCPNWGTTLPKINFDPFWFWHLFKSEKVAQIACRGEGVIWAMFKWKDVFLGEVFLKHCDHYLSNHAHLHYEIDF